MPEYEVWESHTCFRCRGIHGGAFVHAEREKTERLSDCDTDPVVIEAETADEAIHAYEARKHAGTYGVAPDHWDAGRPERLSRRSA